MSAKKKILAFAREPGGADTIAPVLGQLRQSGKVDVAVLAKDYAGARFAAAGIAYEEVAWADEPNLKKQVAEIVVEQRPDVLLTAASSRPEDDMTEKYFWRVGEQFAIPSLAVLDQWQNYILRFSGPGAGEKLAYMPSCVAVMDEGVRSDMVGEGFPDERIFVSGHPRFELIQQYMANVDRQTARAGVSKSLGLDDEAILLTFVSEPARRFFAVEEGFDEAATFTALFDACKSLKFDRPLEIILKYHPRNIPEDFATLSDLPQLDWLRIHHIQNQIEPWDLLLASDLVVGMISILLVDSVILGVPTFSVQLGGHNYGLCAPEKYGAISVAREAEQLKPAVESLLMRADYREHYLRKQGGFAVARDGIGRIENKVYAFAGVDAA